MIKILKRYAKGDTEFDEGTLIIEAGDRIEFRGKHKDVSRLSRKV